MFLLSVNIQPEGFITPYNEKFQQAKFSQINNVHFANEILQFKVGKAMNTHFLYYEQGKQWQELQAIFDKGKHNSNPQYKVLLLVKSILATDCPRFEKQHGIVTVTKCSWFLQHASHLCTMILLWTVNQKNKLHIHTTKILLVAKLAIDTSIAVFMHGSKFCR